MSWIYSGTLPSVEDKGRYTAPPEDRESEKEAEDFLGYQEPEDEGEGEEP